MKNSKGLKDIVLYMRDSVVENSYLDEFEFRELYQFMKNPAQIEINHTVLSKCDLREDVTVSIYETKDNIGYLMYFVIDMTLTSARKKRFVHKKVILRKNDKMSTPRHFNSIDAAVFNRPYLCDSVNICLKGDI